MLSRFFLTISDSHRTLNLALGLVGMHSAAASKWAVTNFHIHHLEYVFQMSPEKYRICFFHLPYIYY